MNYRLRRGDLVEVRTPTEILSSLDSNGTLDGLPFMPKQLHQAPTQHHVALPLRKEANRGRWRMGAYTDKDTGFHPVRMA